MIELIADESVLATEQCRRLGQVYVDWRQGLIETKPGSCIVMRKGA